MKHRATRVTISVRGTDNRDSFDFDALNDGRGNSRGNGRGNNLTTGTVDIGQLCAREFILVLDFVIIDSNTDSSRRIFWN